MPCSGRGCSVLRAPATTPKRAAVVNVLPTPGALCTVMPPPISTARREAMVSPRPVPPNCRVMDVSAWEKASKMLACLSAGMPGPVSRTAKVSCASSPSREPSATSTATSPRPVNLIALPSRLSSTWRRRPGSPSSRSGTNGAMLQVSSRPFWWARSATVRHASVTQSRSENSMRSRTSFSASIFEKSRMSLMIERSDSADRPTASAYRR